jgi:hypothetical protein
MTELITWLSTPTGIEFTHAVIALLVAIAAYLTYATHQSQKTTRQLLDGHLDDHVAMQSILETRLLDKPQRS